MYKPIYSLKSKGRITMAMSPLKGRIRLVMDLQEDLFKNAKKTAVDRNCTMTKWVTRAIAEKLKREKARNE